VLALCEARRYPVKDKLKRFGLFAQIGETFFFPTISAAINGYLRVRPETS
jgi:hypothetical protein